jgi:uncharacterized protein (TIGR03790 family)
MLITLLTLSLTLTAAQTAPHPSAKRVLVVVNEQSADSRAIGHYYASKRGIPQANVLRIRSKPDRYILSENFQKEILAPVRAKLKANAAIDFVVTTKGVPLTVDDDLDCSVDALLAFMDWKGPRITRPDPDLFRQNISPYFGKGAKFSSKTYKMWLVTRLDGYTLQDAKALVDNALASKPSKSLFLFDNDPSKNDRSFSMLPSAMKSASDILNAKGYKTRFDESRQFIGSDEPLMGYVSWGSNDANYREPIYKSLKWRPGAIAETFVSTSGRRFFKEPIPPGGQSLIADLVASGITGVKGYVSEPWSVALARPDILFERYTAGFTLAESFYMASPIARWKDVVIGDPLCAPYAARR